MEHANEKLPLRRRNSRDPIPGREHIIKKPTERDLRIFEKLHPILGYKYLPTNYLLEFIIPNARPPQITRFKHRLGHLYVKPNCYLYRPYQQDNSPNTDYKHRVHALDKNGATALQERGTIHVPNHQLNNGPYHHDLIGCMVAASIEYGVSRDPSLRLRSWKELATGESFIKDRSVPASTLQSTQPFRIPLSSGFLFPDEKPFTIENERKLLAIAGMEVDRDTEPGRPDKHHHISIEQKLTKWREFFTRKLYHHHFGFPNSVVPFVTTNNARLREIMDICRTVMDGPCTYLLFKVVPDYAMERHFPAPNGDMLTEPWLRVGCKPFSLAKLGEAD